MADNKYYTDLRKQPGRAQMAAEWQEKAKDAGIKARLHAGLYMPGGDLVNYLYWQREASYMSDQARIHLGAVLGGPWIED